MKAGRCASDDRYGSGEVVEGGEKRKMDVTVMVVAMAGMMVTAEV